MNRRRIIFLDFDGVVHPVSDVPLPASWSEVEAEIGRRYFHIPAVGLLNCLSAHMNADIVLISSWRHLDIPLGYYSHLFKHRLIDQVPECTDVPLASRREAEICTYLEQFEEEPAFVVIDDQMSHYDELLPQLVSPNSQAGLDESDARDAYQVLKHRPRPSEYELQIEVHRYNH